MITVLFTDGRSEEFGTVGQALVFVDGLNLQEVFGFEGDSPALDKLAYYAGEKKFNRASQDTKKLVTDKRVLENYRKEKGEYGHSNK